MVVSGNWLSVNLILLANDINNGIEHESDFPSESLQGNTSALDGLVSHLIHCVEMVSPARSFQIALIVSFANNILLTYAIRAKHDNMEA